MPKKGNFYSSLNIEDISYVEYRHTKTVFKVFNSKNIGEYHGLFVQSDTLLLSDNFENFRDKCIEINELDLAYFYQHLDWNGKLVQKSK